MNDEGWVGGNDDETVVEGSESRVGGRPRWQKMERLVGGGDGGAADTSVDRPRDTDHVPFDFSTCKDGIWFGLVFKNSGFQIRAH